MPATVNIIILHANMQISVRCNNSIQFNSFIDSPNMLAYNHVKQYTTVLQNNDVKLIFDSEYTSALGVVYVLHYDIKYVYIQL